MPKDPFFIFKVENFRFFIIQKIGYYNIYHTSKPIFFVI